MSVSPGPNPFAGVWQRQFIQFDQGPRETQQRVLWIQAQEVFGDVRSIPSGEALTVAGYRTMTWRQRFDVDLLGFAGRFSWVVKNVDQGSCTWHHSLAITPRSRPDSSSYRWLGPNDFIEQGSCEDDRGGRHNFLEHWHRIDSPPITTWTLNPDLGQGQTLVAGAWAVVVYDQRQRAAATSANISLEGFSATAWHQVAGSWQLQFGFPSGLAKDCLWTPADFHSGLISGAWQCHPR